MPCHRSKRDEVLPLPREEQQIGLHDIELGEHDIERRVEDDAAMRACVLVQREMQTRGNDLMQRKRRRHNVDLAVVQFVPAAVVGPSFEICEAHAGRRSLHDGHFSIVVRKVCRARSFEIP